MAAGCEAFTEGVQIEFCRSAAIRMCALDKHSALPLLFNAIDFLIK